jgi:Cu+-exporting ATPase
VLVGDNIRDVVSAIETSKKIVGKIRQNLVYAFMYNVVLIPVAAMGLLYPALAGRPCDGSKLCVSNSKLACASALERKKVEQLQQILNNQRHFFYRHNLNDCS